MKQTTKKNLLVKIDHDQGSILYIVNWNTCQMLVSKDTLVKYEPEYTFEISLRNGYIYAESSGIETPDAMSFIFQDIINKTIEWQCDRVLYVEGFTNQIATDAMMEVLFELFTIVREMGIDGRIAVFDRNHNDLMVNMFSQSLAVAHGINAKIFTSIEEAESWLKED